MIKNPPTLSINPRILLAIYSVLPISLVFIGVDSLLFMGHAQELLPIDPRVYTWFVLLFMIPHILASFFGFAEREYIHHYRSQLLRGAQIAVVLGMFLPAIAGATIIPVIIFAIYTMVHVFMQQSGISKSLMRNTTHVHKYWQGFGIAIGTVIYTHLLVPIPWLQSILRETTITALVIGIVISTYSLLGFHIFRHSRTNLGKLYFLGTHSMPIFGVFFVATGYPILALVAPRIIHDLTAYTFYISHDTNRFAATRQNLLYRATSLLRIPVYIASPVISILLAIIIARFNSGTVAVTLICIFFMHYYMESVIWKRDTLHRANIRFST